MKMFFKIVLPILLIACPSYGEMPPARVKTVKVTQQNVSKKSGMAGILYYDRVSEISTEVGGLISKIYFNEGDIVKKGDVLVALNTDFLGKEIARQKVKIEQMSIRIERTRRNLERYKKLYKEKVASKTDFEDLSFEYQELFKERDSLAIGLEIFRLKKMKSSIRAPFDGMVLEKKIDIGGWIATQGIICSIGAIDNMFVQLPVSEKILMLIKKGDVMDVTINSLGKKVKGEFTGIRPRADSKTKNVFLKIKIPVILDLVENMSVIVDIPVGKAELLNIIPRDALVKFKGKDYVYTLAEDKAVMLPAEIVSFIGVNAAVRNQPIKVGMDLIVDGNERLKPGQSVEVVGD